MATMCDGDGTDCHPRVVVSDGGGVDDVVDWTLLCLDGGWVVDTGVRGRFSDVRLALTVGSPVVAARGSCAPRSSSRTLGTNGEDPGEDPCAASDGVSGESGDATASSSLVSVANDVISTSSGVDASATDDVAIRRGLLGCSRSHHDACRGRAQRLPGHRGRRRRGHRRGELAAVERVDAIFVVFTLRAGLGRDIARRYRVGHVAHRALGAGCDRSARLSHRASRLAWYVRRSARVDTDGDTHEANGLFLS